MGEAESQETFEELENYIFFKGAQGQETAMQILPLLKQTIREKRKKQKKEKRLNSRSGYFPTGNT